MLEEAKKLLEQAELNVEFYREVVEAAQGWDGLEPATVAYLKKRIYPIITKHNIMMVNRILCGIIKDEESGLFLFTDQEILNYLGFLNVEAPTPKETLRAKAEFFILYKQYKEDIKTAMEKAKNEALFVK